MVKHKLSEINPQNPKSLNFEDSTYTEERSLEVLRKPTERE
jgi:hypothetical protein